MDQMLGKKLPFLLCVVEEPEANSETIVSGLAFKEGPRDTRHMDKVRADLEDEERRMKECNLEPNTYEDSEHYQHKASESDPEQVCSYMYITWCAVDLLPDESLLFPAGSDR